MDCRPDERGDDWRIERGHPNCHQAQPERAFSLGQVAFCYPNRKQVAHCRKQVRATKQVLTTGDLRKMIAENSEIDFDDENKSYVAFNEVVDDVRHQGVRSS